MSHIHDALLESGLNALTRSFVTPQVTYEQFMNGHVGAATIAGHYLLADSLVEPASGGYITSMLAREYQENSLFASMTPEPADPAGIARFLELLPAALTDSCHVGHNVIYPTFALRVFHQHPQLVTPTRIAGLCCIAVAFAPKEVHSYPDPAPFDATAFSSWVLTSFLECVEMYRGHGQGHAGHLLTYGQAVQDLHALGYHALARTAESGYRDYVATTLRGPPGWGRALRAPTHAHAASTPV